MNLIYLAAFIAACGAAKLDRTYLPPPSAAFAGGSPGSLQTPFSGTFDQVSQHVPPGGFVNEHQGVVVEAAAPGTRASNQQSGLGASRISYGSTDSKVGEAAFRVNPNQFTQGPVQQGHGADHTPDLSAFHQPINPYRPGNIANVRDYVSNTVKFHNDISRDKFNYGYETENGIKAAENGIAVNGVQAQGGYSYTGDDGRVYSVSYTADKDGFRPQGSHLPTPPPIPFEILESLEQNAKDEAAGIIDDGSYDAQKYNTDDDYTNTDANDKYNDRQSNKFGKRPGYNTDSGGAFINQNKQGFAAPNFNGQFGYTNDASKDASFEADAAKFGGASGFGNKNNAFSFGAPQSGYRNQFGSTTFGSNDYFPPNIASNTSPGLLISGTTGNFDFNGGEPFTQQNLQRKNTFGKPQSSFERPSSYDIPSGALSQRPQDSKYNQLAPNLNNYNPFFPQNSFIQPFASGQPFPSGQSFSFPSFGDSQQFVIPHGPDQSNQNLNARLPTTELSTSPKFSSPSQNTIGQRQNPTENTFGQNQNLNQNTIDQNQQTSNPHDLGRTPSFSPTIPTKKPQFTLSTPFESDINDPSISSNPSKTKSLGPTVIPATTATSTQSSQFPVETDRNKQSSPSQLLSTLNGNKQSDLSTTSFDTAPKTTSETFGNTQSQITQNNKPLEKQAAFASSHPSDADLLSNTQRPSFSQSSQFPTQPIGADDSYIYKQPSTPFNTPSFQSQPNKQQNGSLNQFNKQTQLSSTQTQFTNPSQVSSFDTQYQIQSEFPSSVTIKDNERNEDRIQNINGVTQASISSFPSIIPTIASIYKQPSSQINSGKLQQTQLNITSQSEPSPVSTSSAAAAYVSSKPDKQNGKVQSQLSQQSLLVEEKPNDSINKISNQQYNTEIYEYNKPAQGLANENEKVKIIENVSQIDKQNPQPILGGQYSIPINQQSFPSSNQKENSAQSLQQGQQPQFGSQPNIQFSQENTPLYKKSENQSPQSGIQPNTQYTQTIGFKQSTTQFQHPSTQSGIPNYNPSIFLPSTVSGVEFNTQKQDSQTVFQNPTTGLQTTTLLGTSDTKETTILEVEPTIPNQKTQFNYKPTTFSSSFVTTPGFNQQTQVVQAFSGHKPITTISPQTQFSGFHTQTTIVPAQFGDKLNTPGNFDSKKSTISQYQKPTQPFSTTFDQISTSIPSATQTETPLGSTQFGEVNDYKKLTHHSSISSENEDSQYNLQINGKETTVSQFTGLEPVTGSKYNTGSTLVPSTPSQQSTFYTQQVDQPSTTGQIYDYSKPVQGLPLESQMKDTKIDQKKEQGYTQVSLKPSQNSFGVREPTTSQMTQTTESKYSTGSTLVPSTPLEQSTFYTQETDQPSTTGEIYDYTKPVQGLPIQSQKTNSNVDQDKTQGSTQANSKPGQNNFGLREPTISQTTQTTGFEYNTGATLVPSTLSEQSKLYTQQTDQPSTTGEIYDYTKPVQGLPIQSQKTNSNVDQEKTQGSTQTYSKPGQNNFGLSEPKISQTTQTTGSKYNTGSTLVPSTLSEQSTFYTQETDQPSTTGEIYDYTKPVQGLPIQSQKTIGNVDQDKTQGSTQSKSKPGQDNVGLRKPTTSQETQTTESKYNTGSTLVPSTLSEQSTFYTQETDQASTTGEIYDYTKPPQGLSSQSLTEDSKVDRKTTPGYTQSSLKLDQDQTEQNIPGQTTQIQLNLDNQNADTLTSQSPFSQGSPSSSKPLGSIPQLSFHSACCQGIKTQNNQGSAPVSQGNNGLSTTVGANAFDLNKNIGGEGDKSKNNGQTQASNLPNPQDFGPQKASQTYAGIGEQFSVSRQPPRYDETGYHY